MADKEKMIELIRKLLALGDKTKNSSEAEANLAFDKAQELLKKYNIELAEVIINNENQKTVDIKVEHEYVFKLKRSSMSSWEKALISIVASATETKGFFNKSYQLNGHGKISTIWEVGYIGTEWDRAIAKELYCFLHSKIYDMSKQFYPESMPQQRAFMEGFIYKISMRINEKLASQKTEETEKYAIVLSSKTEQIEQYGLDRLKLKPSKSKAKKDIDAQAFFKGIEEGEKVDIGTEKHLQG